MKTKTRRTRKRLPPLERGDIVLIRHKRRFFRFFLRRYMKSYWDHTAMVLYPAEQQHGRDFDVIAESIRNGFAGYVAKRGVAIHKLTKYLDDSKHFEIGIKRVQGLSEKQRILVTHIMLMNVDSPYWPWKPIQIVLAVIFPWFKNFISQKQRFSCSGIIQKAYYDAFPWNQKQKVVFKEGVWSPVELQELVTPEDIAASSRSIWIYNKH